MRRNSSLDHPTIPVHQTDITSMFKKITLEGSQVQYCKSTVQPTLPGTRRPTREWNREEQGPTLRPMNTRRQCRSILGGGHSRRREPRWGGVAHHPEYLEAMRSAETRAEFAARMSSGISCCFPTAAAPPAADAGRAGNAQQTGETMVNDERIGIDSATSTLEQMKHCGQEHYDDVLRSRGVSRMQVDSSFQLPVA